MTQTEEILSYLFHQDNTTIRQCAKDLSIIEHNVRRVLGVGAKDGIFERIDRGVYKLSSKGKETLYLYHADALKKLPELVAEGCKADMIFLDVPYNTPAVKGGNRGVKYDLISVEDFKKVVNYSDKLLRTDDSCIVYMHSQAPSGLKAMEKYTECLSNFKVVAAGQYEKLFGNGSVATNMRGDKILPELITIYSRSGKCLEDSFDYSVIRPKGYSTEKSAEMISDLIAKTSSVGDTIIDPFAGSGVVGRESIKLHRNCILIEKSSKAIKYIRDYDRKTVR